MNTITIRYDKSYHSIYISNGVEIYDDKVANFLMDCEFVWNPKTREWEYLDYGPDIISYPAMAALAKDLTTMGAKVILPHDPYGEYW